MEDDDSVEDHLRILNNQSPGFGNDPIRGMESVVATVSGYHGSERFKLIKLITQTGANYVGKMTKSTTHLVCWQFEGKKYHLAKNFGTKIVNHHWFEDCMRKMKRLSEDLYIAHSGQQVAPLLWEVPVPEDACGKSGSLLTKKKGKLFSDRSYVCNDGKALEIDTGCLDAGHSAWSDSRLLKEISSSSLETKVHKNGVRKASKQYRPRKKHCSLETPMAELVILPEESCPYPSILRARHKRNYCVAVGSSTAAEPVCRVRSLVKKNASNVILNSAVLDCEQETSSADLSDQFRINGAESINSRNLRNGHAMSTHREASENGFYNNGETRNEDLDEIEDVRELTNLPSIVSDKPASENASSSQETATQNGFWASWENQKGGVEEVDDGRGELITFPSSTELSCVICWTDFSLTRGVLPCGHRFCYSCIQGWADQMASQRKISTCPLCKACFVSITKVEGAASSDQKIYSQTLPCASSSIDISMLPDRDVYDFAAPNHSSEPVCYQCRGREPEDLLISCHLCRNRWVHSYCLDPPMVPWTCIHCRDLRMLYQSFL